ncbi:hypothetical protein WDV85_04405 [Pseudokineococcus sp. 5B2Z-1]|uniref:DUF7002 family protein n=1 Tax=Pseudokineococcus sp. 5B2Z-1 TaxID=3132744 RepID=UPI0030B1E04F
MLADEITDRWPRLFHMAEAGSWPSIQRHGLLSTQALCDLYDVRQPHRDDLLARKRPQSVQLAHPEHGTAWIRDNKPINETVLRRTLAGMDEASWYRTLNSRVFFWLSEQRLAKLHAAYRGRRHDLLVVSTAKLLVAHGDEVELCPLNSGAVHAGAVVTRGAETFRRIADYPWEERRRMSRREPVVELTVPYAVRDIVDLVEDVRAL